MLNLQELRQISSINPDSSYYVSLYLNVDPVTNPGGEYAIRFKNMIKELEKTQDKSVRKKIKPDIEALERYFIGNRRNFKKALCILTSKTEDFWKEYNLNVPVRNALIVEKTPYLEPLFNLYDTYERYLAILLSKEDARVFVIQMNEIEEYGEVHTPDIVGRSSKGGWFALSQDRYERHRAYHEAFHMADVKEKVLSFMQEQKIDNVIVGGPEETLSIALADLSPEIISRVIGKFSAGMYETPAEIMGKVEPVLKAHERKVLQDAIDQLITRVYKDKQAVMGMPDVLLMLEEGRIEELFIDESYRQSGYFCRNCYALSLEPGQCRFCKGKLEEVNYFADLVMQKAAQLGGKIEVVPDNEKLKKSGGIGAFLRF